MEFSESELANRKPVWIVLSELFLDTDAELSYDYIIRVCSESPYTQEELRGILVDEVAPVVSANLLSVVGEWAGFDEEWLVESVCKRAKGSSQLSRRILKPFSNLGFKGYIDEHWEELAPKIEVKQKNA